MDSGHALPLLEHVFVSSVYQKKLTFLMHLDSGASKIRFIVIINHFICCKIKIFFLLEEQVSLQNIQVKVA